MTGIKPSVLEDVAIIVEKFPCSRDEVTVFLEYFVSQLKQAVATIAFLPKYSSVAYLLQVKIIFLFRLGGNNNQIAIISCVR